MDQNIDLNRPKISVVIPVYGCCACLKELAGRLCAALRTIDDNFEIVLVNDCSPDSSWEVMTELSKDDNRIKSINLSRGFGQHHAITAGLDCARGEWTVVMDCDLQDAPEELPRLYKKAIEGYDMVLVRRIGRKDSLMRRLLSQAFYYVFNRLVDLPADHNIANFGIYSKDVICGVNSIREQNRFFPVFVNWCGFKKAIIDVEHKTRPVGRSSYNIEKLLHLAIDVIVSHSNKPLRFFIKFGILISAFSLVTGILLVFNKLIRGVPVSGWTSLIVSLFFLFGLLFANIGILGLYLGKIFDEVKGRPLYLIKEKINI